MGGHVCLGEQARMVLGPAAPLLPRRRVIATIPKGAVFLAMVTATRGPKASKHVSRPVPRPARRPVSARRLCGASTSRVRSASPSGGLRFAPWRNTVLLRG